MMSRARPPPRLRAQGLVFPVGREVQRTLKVTALQPRLVLRVLLRVLRRRRRVGGREHRDFSGTRGPGPS